MVLLYLRTIRRIRIESFYLTIRTRTGAACIDKVTVFCTESEVTKMENASSYAPAVLDRERGDIARAGDRRFRESGF